MASAPNVESVDRLTSTQEGILFHAVQNEADGLYLQQFTAVLVGELDVERFRRAWSETVARHGALRSLFTWKKRPHPLQVVKRTVELPLDVRRDPALIEGGASLDAFLEADRRRGLPLDVAPLMRLTLVPGNEQRHRFIWTFHHIALDGWSMRIALNEALQRYAGVEPSQPARSHRDFVQWLSERSESAALGFWSERLRGFDEPTRLAVAAPAPPRAKVSVGAQGSVDSVSGHEDHSFRFPADATARLTEAVRASRVTLNAAMRAAWALTLSRFSGSDDVVFGATVSGRPPEIAGVEEIVGMFIHTVPVRARIDREQALSAWCAKLQLDQLDALPFDTTSLAAIQRACEVPAGTPLFESILVMENHATGSADDAQTLAVESPRYLERSHYPLALLVIPGVELELLLVRDCAKVTPETARALLASVVRVLEYVTAEPNGAVADVAKPSQEEQRVLRTFSRSQTEARPTSAEDVLRRFDAAALAAPDALALRCPSGARESTTYRELAQQSCSIARGLAAMGAGPGRLVGVRLPRGAPAVAAILGVLRCGSAYVPIDPETPASRLRAIQETVPLHLIIGFGGVDVAEIMTKGGEGAFEPGEIRGESAVADELAYVLFTSGSTGVPKGVEVTRDALARSTAARDHFYQETVSRFLLLSPLHFDSSVAGLFWTLASGGTLVLPAPGDERDPREIVSVLESEGVSQVLMLPSLYEVVLETAEAAQLGALKTVIVAGEAAAPSMVLAHAEHHGPREGGGARLVNEYGPTEATVWATAMELTPESAEAPVPIGRPVGEVRAYVLDQHRQPVPLGVSGELYLGGPTLARGYARDHQHTASRFLQASPLPERPTEGLSERLYRTGDRVRFDPQGRLLFLGRVDRQIKIRGQRIELGEVEAALQALEGVVEAAAHVTENAAGQPQLMAFVTGPRADEAALDPSGLDARLTGAVRPRPIVSLDSFPRTPSGKIDQPALAALAAEVVQEDRPRADAGASARPPGNEVETTLLGIWREVLGVEAIAVDQDFYGLGGDSLTSIRLVSRAHKAGLEVDLADFAANPTIEGMAQSVGAQRVPSAVETERATGALPLTPVQAWFFSLDLPQRAHWNQAIHITLPGGSHPERVAQGLADRARGLPSRHDALRLRFEQDGEGRWSQRVGDPGEAHERTSVEVVDLRGLGAEQRAQREVDAAGDAQTSFDLATGRLFAARVFVSETEVRGLFVAHHLASDAVSWSALKEDLLGDPSSQGTSAPFAQWVRALAARADSRELHTEVDVWLGAAAGAEPKGSAHGGSVRSEKTLSLSLDPAHTEALLTGIHAAYGTRPREIMLAALSRSLAQTSGVRAQVIDVEGHGREAEAAGVPRLDVSSTVGWMTTVWPLRLAEPEAPDETNRAESIKRAKESVRSVPGNGLGFGLLAHMTSDAGIRERMATIPPRKLLFNFLGRIDGGANQASPAAALDDPRVGPLRGDEGTRAYPLELNAWVAGGALQLRWSYSAELHSSAEIESLGRRFVTELQGLIRHCEDPSAGGVTPSDFPLAGVDQAELDRIAKLLGGGQ